MVVYTVPKWIKPILSTLLLKQKIHCCTLVLYSAAEEFFYFLASYLRTSSNTYNFFFKSGDIMSIFSFIKLTEIICHNLTHSSVLIRWSLVHCITQPIFSLSRRNAFVPHTGHSFIIYEKFLIINHTEIHFPCTD
jgi:hypothetical protein